MPGVSCLQKNISEAYQVSRKSPKPVVRVIRCSIPTTEAVHNYSIQTLNSTELVKKKLHSEMEKVSERRRERGAAMCFYTRAG